MANQGAMLPAKAAAAATGRKDIQAFLELYRDQFELALPEVGLTPQRLLRMIFTQFALVPRLYECTRESLIRACLVSAQLGLEPDGTTNIAWLIPYWNSRYERQGGGSGAYEANFQIGYNGLRILARRSGLVLQIEAHPVWSCDKFSVELGGTPKIEHVPDPWAAHARPMAPICKRDQRRQITEIPPVIHEGEGAKLLGMYGIAWLRNHAHPVIETLSLGRIEELRQFSKTPDAPGWRDNYVGMGAAKSIRQISKHVPSSSKECRPMLQAVALDEAADRGASQTGIVPIANQHLAKILDDEAERGAAQSMNNPAPGRDGAPEPAASEDPVVPGPGREMTPQERAEAERLQADLERRKAAAGDRSQEGLFDLDESGGAKE